MNIIALSEEHDEETSYGYCNDYQPHAVKRMFDYKNGMLYDMRWDEAGNLGQVSMARPGEMFETGRFLFWTEDNRMHAAVDDRYYSYYAYDHSGERRLKLTGDNKLLDVNADFMATYTILNEPTLYPSAYMVLTNKGYTKHYYAGTERVAARLGGGGLDALQPVIGNDVELQKKADILFKQSLEQVNHRVLHENNLECIKNNEFTKEELSHWIDGIPYQMKAGVELDHSQLKDMVHSMLVDLNNGQEKDVYFYHSDHLGSASWITDFEGIAVQHLQYMPYGEPYVNQRISGYSERFTFTGKERDEETGFGYFGARYMDHELMTMWLSVDPMADKYPSISPYAYCAWNPIKLVDPDGNEAWKPDPDGNLIAEKGDNATTLAKFCNTTVENAQKMLSEQGLPSNGEVAEGSKLTMDNVFTRSIQAAKEGKIACLTDEQFDEQTMGMNNDQFKQWWNNWFSDVSDKYNCWGSAITGSQGNEIVGGCGIDTPEEYSQRLSDGYSPVNPSDAVFGKTVISFSRGGTIQHGAVYYGTDNNGVVYVYTKNGWFAPPTVSPLSTVKSEYKSRVSGYHNPN